MQNNSKTRKIVLTAMFAAISSALMFLESSLPFIPPFLKLDLSDIPVLIGAFVMGPLPAVAITLIKDIVHLSVSYSGGIGELADFLISGSLALTAGLIYKKKHTFKWSVLGSITGVLVMTLIAAVANLYLLLPFYSKIMPMDAIIAACSAVNPAISGVATYILYGVVPFNILKGGIIAAVTLPVYRRLSALLFKNSQATE